jgi:hypothetical protein
MVMRVALMKSVFLPSLPDRRIRETAAETRPSLPMRLSSRPEPSSP